MLEVCALALGHQGLLHFTYSRWLIAQDTWLKADSLCSLCCKRLLRHGILGLLGACAFAQADKLVEAQQGRWPRCLSSRRVC